MCVSVESGPATNAISVPSGDHEGPSTFSGPSASMSVPPAFITYRRSGEGGFPPVARSYAIEANQFGDSITRERALDLARLDRENFLTYEDLAMPPATGTVERFRLQLSRRDDESFQLLLRGTPPRLNRQSPYSHKLLANAAERLRADLIDPVLNAEDVSPGEKLESLRSVLQRLTARCYAIHITTEDRDEAYQLFTVLNDRGRSLSDGALLRTRPLELLEGHATMQQRAEGNWDQVLKSSPAQVRGFLRSYYASHRGRRWPSKDLHKVFWSAFFLFTAPLDAEHAEAVVGRIQALAE